MKTYLLSKFRSSLRDSDGNLRISLSSLTISRFHGFLLLALFILLFIYQYLLNLTTIRPAITVISNQTVVRVPVHHHYSFSLREKLLPDFLEKILDKSQAPSPCLIIIRSADGAIGNRMFLFASAYGLARLHQCDLYVAPWIVRDLRSTFRIHLNETPVHLITNDSVVNVTGLYQRYSACTLYPDLLKVPLAPNLTRYEMIGFYQAYGYFVKYKEEISYLFQFNQEAVRRNVPLVEQLLQAVWKVSLNLGNYTEQNVSHRYLKTLLTRPAAPLIPVTWIGIHIRRGDFLTFFKLDTSLPYLHVAMNHYRRKYINSRFLIASDDKDYVKLHFGNFSDVFITPKAFFSGDDLAALALCEHTIVTAGSYGWWAAWLAGGDVMHDLHYPISAQNCIREHYFPPWFVFPHNESSPLVTTNPKAEKA